VASQVIILKVDPLNSQYNGEHDAALADQKLGAAVFVQYFLPAVRTGYHPYVGRVSARHVGYSELVVL
jgi:hypothetical protein